MDWQPVINQTGFGGYTEGFDRNRELEFWRHSDAVDKIQRFRMADMSPYFNIAGLYWRDPAPPIRG